MRWLAVGLLWWAAAWPLAQAQEPQPVPVLSGRVMDTSGVLTPAQRSAIELKLETFERGAGPQIVVLMVPTTYPEDISSYAQRVGEAWKVGRREVGDGLLLVVARQDRRVRIEVAKSLEGAVPDLAARQIIERQMSPAFKQGDYVGGLNAGIDALIARVRGESLPAPKSAVGALSGALGGFDWGQLAMFLFVGVPVAGAMLSSLLGRKTGSVVSAGGAAALATSLGASPVIAGIAGVAALVLVGLMGVGAMARRGRGSSSSGPAVWGSGGGSSWGGGGSSDGGGFSSGGGGDFGGGGASGDW